jgi:1,2-phenylacetyl-CoA epoxidase catalytic subunit
VPDHPPELRPFRVVTYVTYLVFTFVFVGLITRSVWLDLYGDHSSIQVAARLTPAGCRAEIERLHDGLEARLNTPLTPRTEHDRERSKQDWDSFARDFEDRIRRVQQQCITSDSSDPSATAASSAISETVEHLDSLRQHLARCGAEAESEREAVALALQKLRDTDHPRR